MKNRRGFLGALTAAATTGVAAAVAAEGRPAAPPSAPPAPAAPAAAVKPPSAAALAFAQTFRRFDPHLTDAQLVTIAQGIDDGRAAGAALAAKGKPLRNADEPVTRFFAAESANV